MEPKDADGAELGSDDGLMFGSSLLAVSSVGVGVCPATPGNDDPVKGNCVGK